MQCNVHINCLCVCVSEKGAWVRNTGAHTHIHINVAMCTYNLLNHNSYDTTQVSMILENICAHI